MWILELKTREGIKKYAVNDIRHAQRELTIRRRLFDEEGFIYKDFKNKKRKYKNEKK